MNNKGQWGLREWSYFAAIIAAIIMLIVYRAELLTFLAGVLNFFFPPNQPIYQPPTNTSTVTIEPLSFDFSKVSVNFISPLRGNRYSNSNNLVCYSFKNPSGKTNSAFILRGEWFSDGNSMHNCTYEQELGYEDVFNLLRLNWCFLDNYSQARFKLVLAQNKTPMFKEIEYDLTLNENLTEYLKREDDGSISWDDNMIRELISKQNLCGEPDEEQANTMLAFVRNNMNPPLRTEDEIFYNKNEVNFKESWDEKVGTSSEYSYVFASLLRSIGIPAKIETNRFNEEYDYYYVRVYLQGKGWLPVDVFNKSKRIGDCFVFQQNLIRDVEYKDVCIPSLSNYTSFDKIIAYQKEWGLDIINYSLKNVYGKPIKSYCIHLNVTYFDKTEGSGKSTTLYLLGNDLKENGTVSNQIYVGQNLDFESIKLELKEFSDLCE